MLVLFFSPNIPMYIEKNPVEKFCKFLEMELKMYTLFGPKFVFDKTKFKVLHYIHDSIHQRPELSKIRLACSKVFLLINYFDHRL